jgi:ferredoxin hydrogenase small subunit
MSDPTTRRFTVLWLQAGACGGCTMAFLDHGRRGVFAELEAFGIDLLWHPSLSEATGAEVVEILDGIVDGRVHLDALVVEGTVLTAPAGTGRFQLLAGTGVSLLEWIRRLAPKARHTVAVGSCAAYGGIPVASPDPGEGVGLQYEGAERGGALGAGHRGGGGLPVINVAGCAPHPGWIVETLIALATGDLAATDLDSLGRPKFFADHLAHHGCSRNEFYEFKASAETASDRGCLMEHLGCKATQAVGDCNQRAWNGSGSCTDAGYACIACTSPEFERARGFLVTPKVAGIPVGLPLDMPKAWFMALAALSKSATPKRVRLNAVKDHVVIPPGSAKRWGVEGSDT